MRYIILVWYSTGLHPWASWGDVEVDHPQRYPPRRAHPSSLQHITSGKWSLTRIRDHLPDGLRPSQPGTRNGRSK